jgi:8-oxo-dGTP pyrophosphatase MutT (NUDIX family)
MGRVEEGELPGQAAAREVEEETGWRPGPVRLLVASQPSNGSVDSVHYLFRADGATHAGPPSDSTEADRIEWVPLAEVPVLIDRGAIVSGATLIALLYLLMAREPPGPRPHRSR